MTVNMYMMKYHPYLFLSSAVKHFMFFQPRRNVFQSPPQMIYLLYEYFYIFKIFKIFFTFRKTLVEIVCSMQKLIHIRHNSLITTGILTVIMWLPSMSSSVLFMHWSCVLSMVWLCSQMWSNSSIIYKSMIVLVYTRFLHMNYALEGPGVWISI